MTNQACSLKGALESVLNPRRRDLVMGSAVGYSPAAVSPFIESLLSLGRFRGEVVIFVRPSDVELAQWLRDRGVTVALFESGDYPVRNFNMARHFAYSAFLRSQIAKGNRYRCILLSDVRDVVFQKPLFRRPCRDIELHYEDASVKIGEESWNSDWIRREFGEAVLLAFSGRRISCAGTVCGRQNGVLKYLSCTKAVISNLPEEIRNGQWGDQAAHNYVLHSGMIPEAIVLDNFVRVSTVHFVKSEDLCLDRSGRIVNPDGTVSEIVHQWDRHPHLGSAITKKYASGPGSTLGT